MLPFGLSPVSVVAAEDLWRHQGQRKGRRRTLWGSLPALVLFGAANHLGPAKKVFIPLLVASRLLCRHTPPPPFSLVHVATSHPL